VDIKICFLISCVKYMFSIEKITHLHHIELLKTLIYAIIKIMNNKQQKKKKMHKNAYTFLKKYLYYTNILINVLNS
jgi:hypothetical protein